MGFARTIPLGPVPSFLATLDPLAGLGGLDRLSPPSAGPLDGLGSLSPVGPVDGLDGLSPPSAIPLDGLGDLDDACRATFSLLGSTHSRLSLRTFGMRYRMDLRRVSLAKSPTRVGCTKSL